MVALGVGEVDRGVLTVGEHQDWPAGGGAVVGHEDLVVRDRGSLRGRDPHRARSLLAAITRLSAVIGGGPTGSVGDRGVTDFGAGAGRPGRGLFGGAGDGIVGMAGGAGGRTDFGGRGWSVTGGPVHEQGTGGAAKDCRER